MTTARTPPMCGRRWRRAMLAAALALALLLAGCAGAQSGGAPAAQQAAAAAPVVTPSAAASPAPLKLCATPDTPPPALAAKPGYAQFWVTVGDASGQPIAGFAANDFTVSVGGRPAPIAFFREDRGDAPTSLVVLFDASGSMADKSIVNDDAVLLKVRDSLEPTIHRLNACDEAAELMIAGVDTADTTALYRVQGVAPALPPAVAAALRRTAGHTARIRFLQPFTTDHDAALSRILNVYPYGDTPLYDGLLDSIDLLARAHYPNRAVLVITDGIDTSSAVTREQALAALAASGMPLYAIGIGDPNMRGSETVIAGSREMRRGDTERLDADTVKAMAAAGGGHLLFAAAIEGDQGASFVAALVAAEAMLGRGYQIGIVVPTGSTEAVAIAVSGHPGAIVRAERVTTPAPGGS